MDEKHVGEVQLLQRVLAAFSGRLAQIFLLLGFNESIHSMTALFSVRYLPQLVVTLPVATVYPFSRYLTHLASAPTSTARRCRLRGPRHHFRATGGPDRRVSVGIGHEYSRIVIHLVTRVVGT